LLVVCCKSIHSVNDLNAAVKQVAGGSSPLAHILTAAVNLRHRVVFELPLDQHWIDHKFVSVLSDFAS